MTGILSAKTDWQGSHYRFTGCEDGAPFSWQDRFQHTIQNDAYYSSPIASLYIFPLKISRQWLEWQATWLAGWHGYSLYSSISPDVIVISLTHSLKLHEFWVALQPHQPPFMYCWSPEVGDSWSGRYKCDTWVHLQALCSLSPSYDAGGPYCFPSFTQHPAKQFLPKRFCSMLLSRDLDPICLAGSGSSAHPKPVFIFRIPCLYTLWKDGTGKDSPFLGRLSLHQNQAYCPKQHYNAF